MANARQFLLAFFAGVLLLGQSSDLDSAKALDQEITRLASLDTGRAASIRDLAARVALQPAKYRVALAGNLSISLRGTDDPNAIQSVADVLAAALRDSPVTPDSINYRQLAELFRYRNARVTFDHPLFRKALETLSEEDRDRARGDFNLRDLNDRTWNRIELHQKVVVVAFWATWCRPCQAQLVALEKLRAKHSQNGVVILAITDEDESVVRPFVKKIGVRFPILLDREARVKRQFSIRNIPVTLVYDRSGRLARQWLEAVPFATLEETVTGLAVRLARVGGRVAIVSRSTMPHDNVLGRAKL